ncbi:MAG TPA: bifunctional diaminohydroxyphosphoribosylaminopyrimidine deaminase/5-amino-6-(5-phosphoribosylamino)uracil reductase RibD [candidate division Zixibacteria bacterium]|nr:bifunctional diaminohydroxyphosphoribosylaminopyrimidine deaminase/5-amino-6-(5-phosphoribosylamino)uracil reductase RibD [candidate division Zixibacteria bacterium]
MAVKADREYMIRALGLAERARGKTSPNPMVGAVIVRNGEVVGEGYHHAAGMPHAEVNAIKAAGDKCRGATIYVTLEPCCHRGRTGPCTQAIIDAGISRVVFAAKDPDPRVSGGGARQLRRAGLKVSSGLMRDEARRQNEIYFHVKEHQRVFVIVKTAQSLDGRIATVTGDSQWISCPESRRLAHKLRTEVDAVVVGGGTLKADNPALTVRHIKGKNPYRIVLAANPEFPRRCKLIDDNEDCLTVFASTEETVEKLSHQRRTQGAIFWTIKRDASGRLSLDDFMDKAYRFGIRSVMVEGGPTLVTSFFHSRLVDKYVLVSAPKMIGEGRASIGSLDISKLSEAVLFENCTYERVGADCIFIGYPKWGKN